ncbi:monovalent cation/H+ antiporter complex subunit F [Candidatus Cloacimonadaceae bacterium]|jgi:multicomponent Na+:H+ antiporter subunit F
MAELAQTIFCVSYYTALIAMLLAFMRFLAGPSAADRVVALDTMTIIGIVIIVFISLRAGRIIYLDVAMVYGLLSFLGVIAVARYLEGGL